MDEVYAEFGKLQVGKPRRNAAKFCANCCHRKFEEINGAGCHHERNDGTWNAGRNAPADDQRQQGEDCECCRFERECVETFCQSFHALPEHSGNFIEMQSEEVLKL